MKKNLLVVSSLALAAVALASCGNKTNNVTSQEKVNFKEMYTTSAVGAIDMLNTSAVKSKKALSDEEKSKVLENIKYIDEFLNNNAVQSAEKETTTEEKEMYGDYAKTYDLTVNFGTHNQVYKFYYNETVVNDEDDEKVRAKLNEELESHLKGIVVYNAGTNLEKKYEMTGDKEVEVEGNEQEFEVKFTITDLESKAKVQIKQEIEQEEDENEVEYSYKEFDKNGKLVDHFNLEIESEGNETEYVVHRPNDRIKYGYKVVVKDDKTYVDVKIKEGKNVIAAKLLKTETGYEFVE